MVESSLNLCRRASLSPRRAILPRVAFCRAAVCRLILPRPALRGLALRGLQCTAAAALFAGITAVAIALARAAPAGAAEPPTLPAARALFLDLRAARKAGDRPRAQRLRARLDGYPLAPYADYEQLMARLYNTSGAAARRFVEAHTRSPLGVRFLGHYLDAAGRGRRWGDYLSAATREPNAEKLRCYYARAKRGRGQEGEAWRLAERLFLSPTSVHDACDPLFELWRARGGLRDELVWERARLAFAARQGGLLRYIASLAPADPALEALKRVYREPQRALKLAVALDPPRRAEVLALGLERLARYDPARALRHYQSLSAEVLRDEQHARVAAAIARGGIVQREERVRDWVDARLARWGDDRLIALRLRWALAESDWAAIAAHVPALSAASRREGVWRYWRARALEARGEAGAARALWAELATERSYYGFLSADRLGQPYVYRERAPRSPLAHLPDKPSEKPPSEKPPSEKVLSNKAPSEKPPSEKPPSEKVPSNKAPSGKPPSEKSPSEKVPSNKAPSGKASPDKAPSEKTPSEKALSEKDPPEKSSPDKALFNESPGESPDKPPADASLPPWARAMLRRVRELYAIDEPSLAQSEWTHALPRLGAQQQFELGRIAAAQGWYRLAIDAANAGRHWDALELRFPLAFAAEFQRRAESQAVPAGELMAIARRESAFSPVVRSPAGARGLMQLMPSTGRALARRQGRRFNARDLYSVPHNLDLGSAYYRHLLDRFDGCRPLALAAYNAGPSRVRRWLGRDRPLDIWIETIPYPGTRDYVKAVLAYSVVFEHRLGRRAALFTERERRARR